MIKIQQTGYNDKRHKYITVSNRLDVVVDDAALEKGMGTLRLFEEWLQDGPAELIDGGARHQQGLWRVLALLPRLVDTREGGIQFAIGDSPLRKEEKNFSH